MALQDVISVLNNLRVRGVIEDYAIMGGYAVNYYIEPTFTSDLDIMVLVKNDPNLHRLYKYLTDSGYKFKELYILIGDTQVQFFPSDISHLYEDAMAKAKRITYQGRSTKILRVEHLIALSLTSFRAKDKIRIRELIKVANTNILRGILSTYETADIPLNSRLRTILG